MPVSSRTPGGMTARSPCSAVMVPVVLASLILSAIDLPTPGMLRSSAGDIRETSPECPATARAAFS